MSLSPLSDRYRHIVANLEKVLGDKQYFLSRLRVELAYLIILTRKKGYDSQVIETIFQKFCSNADDVDNTAYNKFKSLDATTQHDIKAIEYYIKNLLEEIEHPNKTEIANLVHCGLTSQDVNSVAFTWMLTKSLEQVVWPAFAKFSSSAREFLDKMNITAMGYTHGQPAIPVNIGAEYGKLFNKISRTFEQILDVKLTAKFASSTGNYSTLLVIFGDLGNIHKMQKELLAMLKLDIVLTGAPRQIDDYTSYTTLLQLIQQLALNLKEFALNIWLRITRGELVQIQREGEVGSSVMSHKINPWRLEQAEATSNIIHGLCDAVIRTISVSRDSRDMSDSYALRYMGEIFGNILLLFRSIANDISRLQPNEPLIATSLEANWSSLSEYIQTYLRWNCPSISDPYKLLADFTKGKKINQAELQQFISCLPIEEEHRKNILKMEISKYIGIYF